MIKLKVGTQLFHTVNKSHYLITSKGSDTMWRADRTMPDGKVIGNWVSSLSLDYFEEVEGIDFTTIYHTAKDKDGRLYKPIGWHKNRVRLKTVDGLEPWFVIREYDEIELIPTDYNRPFRID